MGRRRGGPAAGPDLPVNDWVASMRRTWARAVVIGAISVDDAQAAARVARALHAQDRGLVIALGGGATEAAADVLAGKSGAGATVLPDGVRPTVTALREAIGIRS